MDLGWSRRAHPESWGHPTIIRSNAPELIIKGVPLASIGISSFRQTICRIARANGAMSGGCIYNPRQPDMTNLLPVIATALLCSGSVEPVPGVNFSEEWSGSAVISRGGRINFHDTSAVVCANCHAAINHIG